MTKLQQGLCLQRNLFGFDIQSIQKWMTHYNLKAEFQSFYNEKFYFQNISFFGVFRESNICRKLSLFFFPFSFSGAFRNTKLFKFFLEDFVLKSSLC